MCFKEEEEERRGFCLVEWFMEKKKLGVVGGGGGGVIRGAKQGLKLKIESVFVAAPLMVKVWFSISIRAEGNLDSTVILYCSLFHKRRRSYI